MTLPAVAEVDTDRQVFVTADLACYAAHRYRLSRGRLRIWAHRATTPGSTVPVACDVATRQVVFDLEAVMRRAQQRPGIDRGSHGCNA